MNAGPENGKDLVEVVACLGTAEFGSRLSAYVQQICPVDYCSSFSLRRDGVDVVAFSDAARFGSLARIGHYAQGQLWQSDPSLIHAKVRLLHEGRVATRLRVADLAESELKTAVYSHLVDRLLVCSKEPGGTFALSLLRWERSAPFEEAEAERLMSSMPLLMALIDRHWLCVSARRSPVEAFESVACAERCFAESLSIPLRERQVCARLAFGMTLAEAGKALGISTETARSYCQRAYRRLGVTSQRELVVEYMRLWHEWSGHGARRLS
jgi:DNA-binding CsgD family transcriptional regulator